MAPCQGGIGMTMVVKHNMAATETLNILNQNSSALAKSLQKVSSGMRINGAADDASGYAISERMRVQLRGLEQDDRNAQNGISMLKVAEGAVSSTVEILKTLKEKAINAANDTNTDQDRATIQKEVDQSLDQIDDNAHVTFNGKYLINGAMGGRLTGSSQEVILSFMSSLDTGTGSLDEAIKYASGGRFSSEADLVSSFLSDLRSAGSGTAFLKDYCDIDLDNADTGSITGSDAGGETTKTAESIVPESGSPYTGSVPTGSATINGLTVVWPTSYDSDAATKSAEEAIVKALNSQWMKNCLDLVNESYEMSFEESGTTVRTINVKFEDDSSSSTLAYVTSQSVGGITTGLDLTVNMHYYKNLILADENGKSTTGGAIYLDRTLAHEMTHAIMAANIKNFGSLPKYIKEGAAELVHGIDDARRSTITNLVNNPSTMESVLADSSAPTGDEAYAAGYMLLRYFAKQGASSEPPKTVALQVGTRANQAIMLGFGDMRSTALGLKSADGKTVSLATQKKASAAINIFDRAIEKALGQQTSIGALQSRLEYTSNNLVVASENVQSSESVFRDADMAKEMTAYTKNNVLMQAAQSMLAQANQNSSNVLSLLQ